MYLDYGIDQFYRGGVSVEWERRGKIRYGTVPKRDCGEADQKFLVSWTRRP